MLNRDDVRIAMGAAMYGPDGAKIGESGHVYLDDRTDRPEWVTVQSGLFGGHERFVPLAEARLEGDRVIVPYDRDLIKDAPQLRTEQGQLSRDQEAELYRHYGLDVRDILPRDDLPLGSVEVRDVARRSNASASGAGANVAADRGVERVRMEKDRAEVSMLGSTRQSGSARSMHSLRTLDVGTSAVSAFAADRQVRRVVAAIGNNTVAGILGVSTSQPSRWRSGEERMGPENRRRMSDLDHVLDRLLIELYPDQAGPWLTSPNPHLGGARPIDVLRLRGAAPVLEAIDALAQGAFA